MDAEATVKLLRDLAQHRVAGMATGITRWQVKAVSVVLMPQMCRSCNPMTPGIPADARVRPRHPHLPAPRRAQGRWRSSPSPKCHDDHGRDDKAHRRIEPQPSGQRDCDAGCDDTGGDQRIGGHVKKRALEIEVALLPEAKRSAVTPLTRMPTAATQMTMPLATGTGCAEPPDRLPGDAAGHHQQDDRIGSAARIELLRSP